MQGLILAAGMGKRLKELTQDNTKCMVKVNGVRLIERMLSQLASLSIRRTVIVVGYKGDALKDFVGRKWKGMRIDYIENPIYDKTNNIYSLALAANEMCKDDTILLESDIIFEDTVLKKVIDDSHRNLSVVAPWQSWMDGTVVMLGEDNLIKKFIPKREFEYAAVTTYYKTVNIYKFSKEFSRKDYVPFLKAYSLSLGNNEYYEQVLRVVALLGKTNFYALPLLNEKWYEIDDEQDLDIAESMFCSVEEQIRKLSARYGGYWRYPGILDFCYLVTPYFPNKQLREEMKNSFDVLLESYPSGRRVISLVAAKTFGLKPEYIVVGNGAAELIQEYMGMLEGNVGFVYPTFEEYSNRVDEKRRIPFVPSAKNGFRYDARDLIAFFSKQRVSNLILVNPDNPSGNFMSRKEIDEIVSWAKKAKVRLLIDESFVDFADRPYTLLDCKFLMKNPHVSVMKSISKSYGVPGLRLGVLVSADEKFITVLKGRLSIWNINSFAEFFLQVCEKYKKDYETGCEKLVNERNRFTRKLREIKFLTVYPSAANYVLCRVKRPYTPQELAMKLWTGHRILIKDCSNKRGFAGEPFVRLAVRDENDDNVILAALEGMM